MKLMYPSRKTSLENALGSAVLVLLWSSHAAHTPEVQRQLLFAQRLKKCIVPVVLDSTSLPQALLNLPSVTGVSDCVDIRTALLSLLPSAQQSDELLTLYEQATSELHRIRKEAVDEAAAMLQRGEHREEVLALLEYMAHNDPMTIMIREKAQDALDAERKKAMPSPPAGQAPYVFPATCLNGHMAYYDKRTECKAIRTGERGDKQVKKDTRDTLWLKCKVCDEKFIEYIDCEGYT